MIDTFLLIVAAGSLGGIVFCLAWMARNERQKKREADEAVKPAKCSNCADTGYSLRVEPSDWKVPGIIVETEPCGCEKGKAAARKLESGEEKPSLDSVMAGWLSRMTGFPIYQVNDNGAFIIRVGNSSWHDVKEILDDYAIPYFVEADKNGRFMGFYDKGSALICHWAEGVVRSEKGRPDFLVRHRRD